MAWGRDLLGCLAAAATCAVVLGASDKDASRLSRRNNKVSRLLGRAAIVIFCLELPMLAVITLKLLNISAADPGIYPHAARYVMHASPMIWLLPVQ